MRRRQYLLFSLAISGGLLATLAIAVLCVSRFQADSVADKPASEQSVVVNEEARAAVRKVLWEFRNKPQDATHYGEAPRKQLVSLGKDAVPALCQIVRDARLNREVERGVAIEALGEIGDPGAVDPLIRVLGFHGYPVSGALAKIGKPAVEPLLEVLRSGTRPAKYAAAEALGKIGDRRATEPLITLAAAAPGQDRYAVVPPLGNLGDPQAGDVLFKLFSESGPDQYLIVALGQVRERRAVEALRTILRERKGLHSLAAEALGRIGDLSAVPDLIAALDYVPGPIDRGSEGGPGRGAPAPDMFRDYVISALVQMGPPAVKPVVAALQNPNEQIRLGAIAVLGKLEAAEAVEPLMDVLRAPNTSALVGVETVVALSNMRDNRAIRPIAEWLAARKEGERETIKATNLGKFGKPGAEYWKPLLAHSNPAVSFVAAKAMAEVGDEDAVATFRDDVSKEDTERPGYSPVSRWVALEVLSKSDDPRSRELIRQIAHRPESNYRRKAASYLAKFDRAEGTECLLSMLASEKTVVDQICAAEVLIQLHEPRAVEPLLQLLPKCDANLRWRVVTALGNSRDARAIPVLLSLYLKEKDDHARYALKEIGPSVVGPLLEAVGTSDDTQLQRLLNLLEEFPDKRAIPMLLKQMDDPNAWVRGNALRVLSRIDDPQTVTALLEARHKNKGDYFDPPLWPFAEAIAPLVADLEHPSSRIRLLAIKDLVVLEDDRAKPALLAMISTEGSLNARRRLLHILAEIGDPAAAPDLQKWIADWGSSGSKDRLYCEALVRVLACLPADEAVHQLETASKSSNPVVRQIVVYQLGGVCSPAAKDVVEHIARFDSDKQVKEATAYVLKNIQ